MGFVSYSFSGNTAGTPLQSVAAETGGPWSAANGIAGSSVVVSSAGRIYNNAGAGAQSVYVTTAAPASNEYDVEADFVQVSSSSSYADVGCRVTLAVGGFTGYLGGRDPVDGKWKIYRGLTPLATSGATTLTVGQSYHVKLSIRNSGSNAILTLYVDGVQVATATDTSPITVVGRPAVWVYDTASDSAGLHLDNFTAESEEDVEELNQLVFDGTSLTFGQGASMGQGTASGSTYPGQCLALFGSGFQGLNFGVSGQTLMAMTADAGTQIDPTFSADREFDILIGEGGTNDFNSGATVNVVKSRWIEYWQARRFATPGRILVSCTIPLVNPETTVLIMSGAEFNLLAKEFNTWARANYMAYTDKLADFAADSRLSGEDPTYTQLDGVHWTDAGNGIAAMIVHSAITADLTITNVTVSNTGTNLILKNSMVLPQVNYSQMRF